MVTLTVKKNHLIISDIIFQGINDANLWEYMDHGSKYWPISIYMSNIVSGFEVPDTILAL